MQTETALLRAQVNHLTGLVQNFMIATDPKELPQDQRAAFLSYSRVQATRHLVKMGETL